LTPLNPEEKKELDDLEDKSSLEDLIHFRSLANQMIDKEIENKSKRGIPEKERSRSKSSFSIKRGKCGC